MFHKYFEDYGYDSCTSRGVCSISPRMASISEVVLLFLKEFAHYSLRLKQFGLEDTNVKNLILNTLSAFVSNPEIPDNIFAKVICTYTKELEKIKNRYFSICEKNNKNPEIIESEIDAIKTCDVISSIRLGEQKYLDKLNQKNKDAHTISELLFFTAKSIAIYLIELNTLGEDSDRAFITILEILDTLNIKNLQEEDLKSVLYNAAEEEFALINKLGEIKEKLYGTPVITDVSFSTKSGKAILVDGTNLKELENILTCADKMGIDVYTHGELISAHSYPKLRKYEQLKGHFGKGTGNSILDFSTFPGAIFIGRHSIDNIDNLYRGRVFTSDIIVPSGVIKIENDNYEPLCEASIEAKGFKKGKLQDKVELNYSKSNLNNVLGEVNFNNYEGICLITQGNDLYIDRNYFEKFIKLIPNDILVINFATQFEQSNIININAGYNIKPIFETISFLKEKIDIIEKPIIAFVPRCDKHITNLILNLKLLGVKKIFMGKCAAKNINPLAIDEFCKIFDITKYTNVKDDYKIFIDYLTL